LTSGRAGHSLRHLRQQTDLASNAPLKPLDHAFYFSLKRPTTRQMYRALDRFFYRCTSYSSDLCAFAHANTDKQELHRQVIIGHHIKKLLNDKE